jgi:hypothetical protein
MVLVALGLAAMGLVHNLIGRFLGQMMMHLDALGFAIAMALGWRGPLMLAG